MASGNAIRNRSAIVTVATPRGRVEVVRQEMKGLRASLGWTWFWIARRAGQQDWREASTAREAIRRATLLAPKRKVAWLDHAAAAAERQLLTDANANTESAPPP
jgi:hypothetical protein